MDTDEPDITLSQLAKIEDLEYAEAIRKLLLDPSFHTFMVRWMVDTRHEGLAATGAADLHVLNWKMARASLMTEFMDGLAETDSGQYLQLTQEMIDYGGRRKRASGRADTNGADDGYAYDPGDDIDTD